MVSKNRIPNQTNQSRKTIAILCLWLILHEYSLGMSQTFGYSVAGGSEYGAARLGEVTFPPAAVATPVPAGVLIALVGGASLLPFACRRRGV